MRYAFVKGCRARTAMFFKDRYRVNWHPVKRYPRNWWKLSRPAAWPRNKATSWEPDAYDYSDDIDLTHRTPDGLS